MLFTWKRLSIAISHRSEVVPREWLPHLAYFPWTGTWIWIWGRTQISWRLKA